MCSPSGKSTQQLAGLSYSWPIQTQCPYFQLMFCIVSLQDDLSGCYLLDTGLDDVEIHQFPVEKVAGAQPEPGLEKENSQPEEQASQTRSGEGWVFLCHCLHDAPACFFFFFGRSFNFVSYSISLTWSPLSHQAALPTESWSATTKHLRGPERPKPRRAESLWGRGEKRTERAKEFWPPDTTSSQLQNYLSAALKKKKKKETTHIRQSALRNLT